MGKALGILISEERDKKGISQRELARRIDVDNSYIAKIESGAAKKPAADMLYKISKELDINLIELLKSADYSDVEIYNYMDIGNLLTPEIDSIKVLGEEIPREYIFEKEGVGNFVDIGKILDNYKNNKIDFEMAVKLIYLCQPFNLGDQVYYFSENGEICIDI